MTDDKLLMKCMMECNRLKEENINLSSEKDKWINKYYAMVAEYENEHIELVKEIERLKVKK